MGVCLGDCSCGRSCCRSDDFCENHICAACKNIVIAERKLENAITIFQLANNHHDGEDRAKYIECLKKDIQSMKDKKAAEDAARKEKMSHQHKTTKCKECGTILDTCRCASPDKLVIEVVCHECILAGKSTNPKEPKETFADQLRNKLKTRIKSVVDCILRQFEDNFEKHGKQEQIFRADNIVDSCELTESFLIENSEGIVKAIKEEGLDAVFLAKDRITDPCFKVTLKVS